MNKILLTIFFLYSFLSYAQNTKSFGGCVTGELAAIEDGFDTPVAGLGLTLDIKGKKHSGFETGLLYRSLSNSSSAFVNGQNIDFYLAHSFLSVPLMYKYYSNIVNVSLGCTIDFYVGSRIKGPSKDIINLDRPSTSASPGFIVKLSKSISFSDKIILEPDVHFTPNLGYEMAYIGVGLAIKSKF
jgi:hypothetical protein